MRPPHAQRSGLIRSCLGGLARWSWRAGLLAAAAWLAPLLALILGHEEGTWLAAGLFLTAMAVSYGIAQRHVGWQLLGPHFYYDVVRLARRGQSTRLRVAYLLALFIALSYMVLTMHTTQTMRPNDFARISERFAYVLFLVQNIAVVVLTPAYVATALGEEKERRTLELLFTTQLRDTEIVLGIFFARALHLVGIIMAGFPILCLIQFWGGIDMQLLTGNLVNTLLNILTIGSVCMLASTLTRTAAGGMMFSYLLLFPLVLCCSGGGVLVLQDARSTPGDWYTVQHLFWILLGHAGASTFLLSLAVMNLRDTNPIESSFSVPERYAHRAVTPERIRPLPEGPRWVLEAERLDVLGVPYTLPPIPDNSLLWKERFLGGPPFWFSPIWLVVLWPMLGFAVILAGFTIAVSLLREDLPSVGEQWSPVVGFFYYFFLVSYGLSVAFSTTSSVTRERQQQTLEPLLLLPVERREILFAKGLGSLWRSWPWMALVYADVAVGIVLGVYHPFSAVVLCLAPWPLIGFFSCLGLLLSVTIHSVLRANLVMVLVLILFFCSLVVSGTQRGALAFLNTWMFSFWELRTASRAERGLALGVMAFYLCGAWACWRLARYAFEKRTHSGEE